MHPDTTIIIHAFGCHLTHVPIGNHAALADLSAGVDRDKWGWYPIEPAAVRGRIDRDRGVRVIVTEAVTPTAEAMLVADGLDPLVISLARAEEWR